MVSLSNNCLLSFTDRTELHFGKQRGGSIICLMSELKDDFMTLEDLLRFSASKSDQREHCTFDRRDPVLSPRV